MKVIRKIFKLFLPAWYMHRRLDKKFGIKVNSVSESDGVRFIVSLLPYFISAILQQRKPTDRRVYKYFLPYGKMCDHIHAAYAKNVRNPQKDIGIWGKIRSCFPYGLILWWDNEDKRLAPVSVKPSPSAKPSPTPSSNPMLVEMRNMRNDMTRMFQNMRMMQDRMEILSLRTLLGGKLPSASVVLTGRGDLNDLIATIERLSNSSLMELQIIIATDIPIAIVNENINLRPGVSIEYVESTGFMPSEVYNFALKKATGDYIGFLEVGDYYSTDDMLEYLMLRALNERAQVYGGSVAVNWKNPRVGLSSVIFDRKWLISSGLEVCFNVRNNEGIFIRCAKALADHSVILQRSVVNHVPLKYEISYTEQEHKEDILNTLQNASRVVREVKGKEVLTQEVEKIIKDNIDVIRDLVWQGGVIQKDKADIVKDILSNIGKPEVAENILNPLVSVIVPAYNVEKYLSRCIDSLVMQTLSSIEIIVVDDGSSDSTPEIADEYAKNYPQVKVIHRKNGGLSAARNSGMKKALGKYIGFVDGDDYVDSIMYETMSKSLERECLAEIALCSAKVEFEFPVSDQEVIGCNKYFTISKNGSYAITNSLLGDINASCCTKLYKRSFIERNKIRFPEGMNNEDEVFFFFTMARATHLVMHSSPWYHYMRNQTSIMARQIADMNEEKSLPDGLTMSIPLICRFLDKEDRLDMMGLVFRRLCGLSNRFPSEKTYRLISKILHKCRYEFYADFLDDRDVGYVQNRLNELYNYIEDECLNLDVDETNLPILENETQLDLNIEPVMSFIMPVFNAERYLAKSIESLRRQTLKNIEILCVDDGSTDRSVEILEFYARRDGRIRILRQNNLGVSVARKKGLENATGRYVAFIDADDWVDLTLAEQISKKMELHRLNVCLFDYECFDYKSRKSVPHWWCIKNHLSDYILGRVFSSDELRVNKMYGTLWSAVWDRDFISQSNVEFPSLSLGEDLAFWMRLLPLIERMFVEPVAYYHYRRGNPSSAVSRLNDAKKHIIELLRELCVICQNTRSSYGMGLTKLVVSRCIVDIRFHANKKDPAVLEFLKEECLPQLQKCAPIFRDLNSDILDVLGKLVREYDAKKLENSMVNQFEFDRDDIPLLKEIELRRKNTVKDLYIVMGQLNSTTNEPIDSWTFFQWLQKNGIPSRYVMWREHSWYDRIKRETALKDVILLSGNGVDDFEFLEKCRHVLPRAKAVIQENGAINATVGQWLYQLEDCERVFLQHGVLFVAARRTIGWIYDNFNSINVSSSCEKLFIESQSPLDNKGLRFIQAGLPRWDVLKDESKGKKVLFVMPTWRRSFNGGMEIIKKSAYYHGYKALFSKNNIEKFKALGLRVVFAPHHHLLNFIQDADFDFGESVTIAKPHDISYWIRNASMCLTDFSSVSFDFLFLNKPVVYWIPDTHDLLLNISDPEDGGKVISACHYLKSMFNVLMSLSEVMDMIEYYERNNFILEPDKVAIAETFFANKKNICEKLYKGIEGSIQGGA